jgi:hypothetical protein
MIAKHIRLQISAAVLAIVALLLLVAPVQAAPYGADAYGACEYSQGCDPATGEPLSGDLSNTGRNQQYVLYGALVLLGAGLIAYTYRKRHYKLHR